MSKDEQTDVSRRDFQKLLGVSGAAVLGGVSFAGCQSEGQASIPCPYGDQTFESESALKDHLPSAHAEELRSALGSGPIPCPYGDQEFESLSDLRTHIKAEHADEISLPSSWDREVDVVVVGFGGAGGGAAIEAHDAGAEVLVIEEGTRGGNTAMAGALTVPKDGRADEAAEYYKALSEGMIEDAVIESWAEVAEGHMNWLQEISDVQLGGLIAIQQDAHHDLPGSDSIRGVSFPEASPFYPLNQGVEDRDIEVLEQTPGRELITSSSGEVVGVRAERDGEAVRFRARRGVVIACGGFSANEAMRNRYLPIRNVINASNDRHDGDNVRLGKDADAQMWKMSKVAGNYGHLKDGVAFPGWMRIQFTDQFLGNEDRTEGESGIIVNEAGDRFASEEWADDRFFKAFLDYDPRTHEYRNIPAYFVFDETARTFSPVGMPTLGWSSDNTEEIEAGIISQGESIEALAQKIPVESDALVRTVEDYNARAAADDPEPFGRQPKVPLDSPPYYAVKGLPQLWGTLGGPKHDEDGQVLDEDGEKIPGLYAAGYASNGIIDTRYQLGSGLSDAHVYGRIAGRNAGQAGD